MVGSNQQQRLRKKLLKRSILGFFIGGLIASTVFIGVNYKAIFVPKSEPVLYTIKNPYNTSFAEYQPLETKLPERGPEVKYKEDLSDVQGLDRIRIPEKAKEMLSKNGFVVLPTDFDSFSTAYFNFLVYDYPLFITSDAILQLFHQLYDQSLRHIEYYSFYQILLNFTMKMLEWANNSYYHETIGYMKDAYMRISAIFGTALKLLGVNDSVEQLPEKIQTMINEELNHINSHSGSYSPILEIYVDYTQFIVRGHYTRNEVFARYFKAMMFYIQMAFYFNPPIEIAKLDPLSYTRMALLISKEVISHNPNDVYKEWKILYDPVSFLVGKADDLCFYDLEKIVEKLSFEDIANNETLQGLISKLISMKPPKIKGTSIPSGLFVSEESLVAFRIISQAYIPDSFFLQNLITPKVPHRVMPSGLDVMAVFGSKRALNHLEEEIEKYPKYLEQLENLKNFVNSWNDTTWAQNIYYLWLYSILPLLNQKGKEYASFMRTQAWADKELVTALSTWAEMRHDTILYAKQSTLSKDATLPSMKGYVEPNPELFSRLYSLALMLKNGLLKRNLLQKNDYLLLAFEKFLDLTYNLTIIAEKELFQIPLSPTEEELIHSFPKIFKIIKVLSSDPNLNTDTDQKTAVIADVHSDADLQKVLEVGVGKLYIIFVIVPDKNNNPVITVGFVFTYHEFFWDMNNRLTDEEWQRMLEEGTAPPIPTWVTTYVYKKE